MPATKRAHTLDSSDEEENRAPSLDSSRSLSPELRDDLPADELYKITQLQQKKANEATKALQAAECKLTDITNEDQNYNPLAWWENRESKVQGKLADLLEILPPKFRGETMHAQWFINTFHVEMGTQFSNIATRVRRCAPEIFNCTATDLLNARWAVSADITLTPRGAQTGNGLNKCKKSVLRLFRDDDADRQLQDAMDMLDADEEEEPAEEA
ncbi:hypothetical protein B0H16DRAFT_1735202 [Mycena metata]|uniref:Uncharacterized protein n=1 Tax=Mycena metata TaxID=1033252 RepID=A0AAD7MPV5_9AGAR|nr:hypothetical protein B0H16DRAFT_1735202 [Mycena metata]